MKFRNLKQKRIHTISKLETSIKTDCFSIRGVQILHLMLMSSLEWNFSINDLRYSGLGKKLSEIRSEFIQCHVSKLWTNLKTNYWRTIFKKSLLNRHLMNRLMNLQRTTVANRCCRKISQFLDTDRFMKSNRVINIYIELCMCVYWCKVVQLWYVRDIGYR